jgi:hypothetical protein
MNRYGQMALDHNRKHRPDAYSQIPDPAGFFAEAGEQIAAAVSQLRDEILGPPKAGETPRPTGSAATRPWQRPRS